MSFVYFTDRDLGKRFPEILKSSGLTVERHADHFSDTTPDETWLEVVGKRGWIALTHDHRIRYKPNVRFLTQSRHRRRLVSSLLEHALGWGIRRQGKPRVT